MNNTQQLRFFSGSNYAKTAGVCRSHAVGLSRHRRRVVESEGLLRWLQARLVANEVSGRQPR